MPEVNILLALFLAGLGFFPLVAILDRNNAKPAWRAGVSERRRRRHHSNSFTGA